MKPTVERGKRDKGLLGSERLIAIQEHVGGESHEQHCHGRQCPQDATCDCVGIVRGIY